MAWCSGPQGADVARPPRPLSFIVGQSVRGSFVSVFVSNSVFRTTHAGLLERKRTIPDKLHAIAKPPNATDQMVDCSDEENAGSITNGNDNKANIDPTLDSE